MYVDRLGGGLDSVVYSVHVVTWSYSRAAYQADWRVPLYRPGPVRTSAVRPPATAGANGDTQPTGLNSYIAPHTIRFLTSQHSHNLLANFQVRLFPPIPDFIIDYK